MEANEHARAWLIAAKEMKKAADDLEENGHRPAAEQMQILANAALYIASGYQDAGKEPLDQ